MTNEKEHNCNGSPVELLLRLKHTDELTEQDVARMTADDAAMRQARELWQVKKALDRSRIVVPDVEKEWNCLSDKINASEKFNASDKLQVRSDKCDCSQGSDSNLEGNHTSHLSPPTSHLENTSHSEKASHLKRSLWLALAAVLLLLFVLVWNKRGQRETVSEQNLVVYEASDAPRDIVISTGKGHQMVLGNEQPSGTETVDATSAEPSIVYRPMGDESIVESHTVTIPQGKMLKVVLCDGSEVWVNAGSRLVYPTCFVGGERQVELDGEAYFKVTPDATRPFVVKSHGSYTRVLGTEFNVRSYVDQPEQVTLVKGKVEVSVNANGKGADHGKRWRTLTPGQQLSMVNHQVTIKEVDTDVYTYRRDGYFFFDDERMDELMRQIGSWYNVSVVFRNPKPRDYKIHFFCERSSKVEQVVEQLNMLQKAHMTLSGHTIYID